MHVVYFLKITLYGFVAEKQVQLVVCIEVPGRRVLLVVCCLWVESRSVVAVSVKFWLINSSAWSIL